MQQISRLGEQQRQNGSGSRPDQRGGCRQTIFLQPESVPDQYYDTQTGIHLSELTVHKRKALATRINSSDNMGLQTAGSSQLDGATHFVYRGKSGQKVRLAGTFTKWDSWIYELRETAAGLYELDLPLPSGTYYYVYYIGAERFPDRTNHDMAWTDDGRQVSKLVVE
jgi:hypothetical protein